MKGIVAFSGGLDSTVLLAQIIKEFKPERLSAVFFSYGAKNEKHERHAKDDIVAYYGKKGVRIQNFFFSIQSLVYTPGSYLTDPKSEIPKGHHRDEVQKKTVVPGRNLIFAS